MKKGGKRSGSGRKPIKGKEIKVKLPYEVLTDVEDIFEGETLANKIRASVISSIHSTKEKKKNYNVLDLFCGAGGLSYGFKLAGFSIVGGIEWEPSIMLTHKNNFKSRFEFTGDIKDVTDETIKKHFKEWLYRVIAYFGIRLENFKEEKSLYHLYRLESLIRHYKETGKFEYYFSKENYELAKDLKTKMNIEEHLPKLKEIFSYLLSLYKEEES